MSGTHPSLGRLDDLPPGALREVEIGQRKILLVRCGDEVRAVGAACPHAGAPLAQGILVDGRVICPWHKAAFSVRTGACLDPPAVDDIEVFPVEVREGEILLAGDGAGEALPPAPMDPRRFVILGAGAAGFSAGQEFRRAGFGGAVVMVSDEDALPYDRTVLSKYVLSGQEGGEKSPLQSEEFFERQKIERRLGEVTALDKASNLVMFADGGTLSYDALLIATGSHVVPPPFPGAALGKVFGLRTAADAARIVDAARGRQRAVVIGASFIGMEVAAALTERGLDVTVVTPEAAPFARTLGAVVGSVYREIHEEKGVKFRLKAEVERLEGEHDVRAVQLAGGERLETDLVVAGLGVRPATGFATGLTSGPDHALGTDEQLRVETNIFAGGDVAAFPLHGNGPRVRVEHWRVAEQHGRVAARAMLGLEAAFTAVPYFWTIQYMIRLDYVGHAGGDDTLVMRGDPAARNFIAYYLRDGTVAAAAGMNRDQDMAAIIALMERRQGWTVDELHPAASSPRETLTLLT